MTDESQTCEVCGARLPWTFTKQEGMICGTTNRQANWTTQCESTCHRGKPLHRLSLSVTLSHANGTMVLS